MKNIKNIFLASTLASVALVGCNDLDTAPTGSTITSTQKEELRILPRLKRVQQLLRQLQIHITFWEVTVTMTMVMVR